ncbi:MAG: glutamate--tRNA ligase [Acidimicrobiales bacterium]
MSAPATGADVRVRFSPAPTGYLHVGSARSALFNWMYARHTGGTMILRIEDTDADRSKPELVDAIRDSLGWLGIDWDEEYRQSDRFDQYRAAADSLVERGLAYYCDSTPEEVKARNEARGDGATGYDGYNRDRGLSFVEGKTVVRFRTPETGTTEYDDLIRGHISFDNSTLEDFVIVRSSGVPLFHVANAWDDLTMGITHVVRGEDLVNTVPRVLLLREAMAPLVDADPTPPVFAHLPLIVNEQRKKLSKRRDDVSVGDYRDRGFLADAMRNYLLTLGWGPRDGGDEIRPIDVFVEQFELDDINKAPAFFDVTKLEHFNGEYLRALSVEEFVEVAQPHLGPIPADLFAALAPYAQERVKVLDGIPELLGWIVDDAPDPSDKDWKKVFGKGAPGPILDRLIEALGDCDWTAAAIEETVFGVGTELDAKTQLPVRLALTGVRAGIPLWEPMAWMDRAVVLDRLRATRARLG